MKFPITFNHVDGAWGGLSPEQPGGCYVIEADSLDEAIEWARKGRFVLGSNEVRRIY